MPYSEQLAARVRDVPKGRRGATEKKMFGSLAFMSRGHMCCGVIGERLVVRVRSDQYEKALSLPDASPMDFTGRPTRRVPGAVGLRRGVRRPGRCVRELCYARTRGWRPDSILDRTGAGAASAAGENAWGGITMDHSVECARCKNRVHASDDFCPHCGTLLALETFCARHDGRAAEGVCIICARPACSECGGWAGGLFLCATHRRYEIYEGMARVFGTSDPAVAEHAQSCLSQADLHPFLYSRKTSPLSLGGPDYSLFRASGEFHGHIINEIKVMVLCQEVESAEQVLADLGFLSDG